MSTESNNVEDLQQISALEISGNENTSTEYQDEASNTSPSTQQKENLSRKQSISYSSSLSQTSYSFAASKSANSVSNLKTNNMFSGAMNNIDNFIAKMVDLRDSLNKHIYNMQQFQETNVEEGQNEDCGEKINENDKVINELNKQRNQRTHQPLLTDYVRTLSDSLKSVSEHYSNLLGIGSQLIGNIEFRDATPNPATENSVFPPPRYNNDNEMSYTQLPSSASIPEPFSEYDSNKTPKIIVRSQSESSKKQPILIPKRCLNLGDSKTTKAANIGKSTKPAKVGVYTVTLTKRPFNIALSQDNYCVTKTFKNISKKYGIKEGDQLIEVNGKSHGFSRELKYSLPVTMKFCRRL